MSIPPDSQPTLHQLPFPLHLQEKYTFENFYVGPNAVALGCLQQLFKQNNFTHSIYLWGHRFVGCSHLLHACCEAAQQSGLKIIYLSLLDIQQHHDALDLDDMFNACEFVCLDDIEAIAHSFEWEEVFFHLYNRLVKQHIPIIFAAHQVPHQLPFRLPDLISRLNSGLLFQIHELNDTQKMSALQLRAHLRGLELSESVANFLLSRLPRSPRILVDALNQLDLFSLARQRKLTIPFVKEVLEL
jgi:DnaA family protein